METKSIRISAKHYAELVKIAKANGQTLSGLLSFVMGLYLNDRRVNLKVSQGVKP